MTLSEYNEFVAVAMKQVAKTHYRALSDAMEWRHREDKLARVETLSAAHRLIQSLSEQTQSRSEIDECRDVMARLERMVEEG